MMSNSIAAFTPEVQDVDPGRLDLEDTLQPIDPTLAMQPVHEPKVPEVVPQEDEPTFELKEIEIEGATAISLETLQKLAESKLNQVVTLSDLQQLANKMTILYRKQGYILSQVVLPPQEIEGGIVKFKVIEGYIDKVYIDENNFAVNPQIIYGYSNLITLDKPLNFTTLERALVLSNALPGITLKSYLSPSKQQVGAATLTIRIEEQKQFEPFFVFDNKIDKQYGPTQLTAGATLNYNSLTDKTQIIGRTSSHDRIKLMNLSHTHFIGTQGGYFTFSGQEVRTRPHFDNPAILPVLGDTKSFDIAYFYPFIKLRSKELLAHAKLDWLDTRSEGQRPFQDKIRSLRLGVDYRFIDTYLGSNSLGVEISKGLKLFGATRTPYDKGQAALVNYSRPGGRSNYTKLNIHAARLQYLPKQFSVLLDLEGQWSAHELLSAEELGFGGYRFGRGYESSSFVADEGVIAKVEGRYDHQFNKAWLDKIQPYVFYDIGFLYDISGIKLRENPGGQLAVSHIRTDSAGFGLRVFINKNLFGEVSYSKPIGKQNKLGNRKSLLHFSLSGNW